MGDTGPYPNEAILQLDALQFIEVTDVHQAPGCDFFLLQLDDQVGATSDDSRPSLVLLQQGQSFLQRGRHEILFPLHDASPLYPMSKARKFTSLNLGGLICTMVSLTSS